MKERTDDEILHIKTVCTVIVTFVDLIFKLVLITYQNIYINKQANKQ